MHETDLLLFGVLAAVSLLVIIAQVSRLPYPITLVVGGIGLGFVPGVPSVELNPDLVFLIVLPPLLYAAAFFSSLRDLQANLRPISLLSIGLTLATTVAVAWVAHMVIPGLTWAAAFVLGAIVSPTDPIAASSIGRRLGVPRRVVTVIEGESLINDATGLIAYRFAIGAAVGGSFSLADAGLSFLLGAAGGVAIGLAVGWLVAQVRGRIDDPPTEIVLSLITSYLAYLPASALGASGVLAAVTVGIYLGWRAPRLTSPNTRLQAFAVWETLVFALNSLLFVLIGLQLPSIIDGLSGRSAGRLALYAAVISAVVIVVRIVWVFPFTYGPRLLSRRVRERDPHPPWQLPLLVSWSGMRGAVSLAAALALPLRTDAGAPFPDRSLIVFLAFSVIVVTLLGQGLSLPWLVRRLGVEDDGSHEREEIEARRLAAEAAIARIEEIDAREDWVREDTAERMKGLYHYRRRRFEARADPDGDGEIERRSLDYQRLQREILEAQRDTVVELRNQGRISDEVMHRIERDLDLEDTRLEI